MQNPLRRTVDVGLRFCPRCGIVTFGEGLPECRGKVMWRDTVRGIVDGGHSPTPTMWAPLGQGRNNKGRRRK